MRIPSLLVSSLLSLSSLWATSAAAADWPPVSGELPANGLGANDAAVVIGISEYAFLPKIGGASNNANDWFRYLVKTRGVPLERTRVIYDVEATAENIKEATTEASRAVGPGGTLWFIFIGHGAPNTAHDDGILVGADTQLQEKSLIARGVAQKDLLQIIDGGQQAHAVAIFDACFSGTAGDGKTPLVPGSQATVPVRRVDAAAQGRTAIFSSSDQVAGPLPGHDRPAFSYLLLGAVRGWADKDKDLSVTTVEAFEYSREVLRSLVRGRNQIPSIRGSAEPFLLSNGASESGPDLVDLQSALAPTAFRGSALEVPTIDTSTFSSSSLRGLNIPVEKALERAIVTQGEGTATSAAKRDAWCALSGMTENNAYIDKATGACADWTTFVNAEKQLESSMSTDYEVLVGYMELKLKSDQEKLATVEEFLTTYGKYADHQEVQAARMAKQNLEEHKPPGIAMDGDADHLLVDACPDQAEDFDGDADDDGCPEQSVGEQAGKAMDDATKAIGDAGIHFYFLNWGNPTLDSGVGVGVGVYDEPGVPAKLDRPTPRPSIGWSNRFSWGLFETGANIDWDLARDLEDQAITLDVYGGVRVVGISRWTPSLGVDYRNALDWASGRAGGPGVYFGNVFVLAEGLTARLTYRYGLDPPGGIVPVHAVFAEMLIGIASPAGSPLLDILEDLDLCD